MASLEVIFNFIQHYYNVIVALTKAADSELQLFMKESISASRWQ